MYTSTVCAWVCVLLSFAGINQSNDMTHLSVCILVCTHVPVCAIEYMYAYACLCTCVHVCRHGFVFPYVHMCFYVYFAVLMWINMCICVFVYGCMDACT